MKELNVNGKLGRFNIKLPESLEEVSVDYLKKCTEFVNCAPNYAVVAVVYKDSLTVVLTAAKKNQAANVAVIPVFIKAGKNDSEFIQSLHAGDRCVISASDLSLGHHINSPYNKITPNNVINLCDGDRSVYNDALMMRTPVCFIEFKLLPISAIHAKLDTTKNEFDNPFITKIKDGAETIELPNIFTGGINSGGEA